MSLTQESVLSFLLERGGKVKNSELLNNFGSLINCGDPAEKLHNRDLFKRLVNSVAVVKQMDGAKFVVVKKRYQDFVREDASVKTHAEDSFSSPNASFSYASPRRAESARIIYSDIENNNVCCPSGVNGNYYEDAKHAHAESVQKRRLSSRSVNSADTTTVKVLNISGDQGSRAGKSGAVFAVIAVKSPPRDSSAAQEGLHHQVQQHKTSHQHSARENKVSANLNSLKKDALRESKCWKSRQTEETLLPGFPDARPQDKTTTPAGEAKYSDSVPLEPLAHEWLVKCASGLWGHINALLLRDTRLAQRKDFMSGFTALHWAAKDGNGEMIHKLMDVSRRRGTHVNVNSKAHGGYTPLHIAAIHGHAEVIVLLVQTYGANVNERDDDGKKACHYLGKGVPAEVRALLGGGRQGKKAVEEEEEYREHTKGFNTISKLFHPHMGKKQKTNKFAHDW
ncbi:ankyrin repeat domain-containing protein SOWAHB [Mugil cephalus]|uniref:ankyrin repeat domain-containing protein SOWAHB n=1 Tax=Mugil cephalus TaxID=48193 RepID=UPI001FB7B61E|nr:ankyrin repeat domain-containing protein SOWAHB [Mugil cephalus]